MTRKPWSPWGWDRMAQYVVSLGGIISSGLDGDGRMLMTFERRTYDLSVIYTTVGQNLIDEMMERLGA